MRSPVLTGLLLAAAALPAAALQQPIPLDTVHVSAGSRLVAGAPALTRSVDVLDRRAIDALPARTITDVIARALGVDLLARSPAQADLSVRGSGFEQVLVLVDGVPVNDTQTGHFHLDLAVPLDAVERVEVLRGPASAVYGSSAVGGVVNIVTRNGSREVSARAQAGSFGAWALGADAAVDLGSTVARLSAGHDASDGHRSGTDHRITQVRGSIGTPLAGGELHGAAGYAARDFGAAEFYAPFDSYEETRTATASLSWRNRPAEVVVEPRVSFRQHDDDFILVRNDPSIYRNIHTTRQTDGELVVRWRPDDRLALAVGGEGRHAEIESNALGDRSESLVGGFAEAAVGSARTVMFTAGIRVDEHSAFGTFLSGSAAAAWQALPALRFRASGATGYRTPSWTDRYYEDPANIGNPDLRAEKFRTAELGATVESGVYRLDAATFVRHARDLIDWGRPVSDPETEPWRTLNVEEATFVGLETSARVRLDNGVSLTGRVALISFDAEENEGFVSKYALQPLTRSLSLEATFPVTESGTFAVRGGSARRADGEAWEVVDARATARLFGAEIFADVTNLLDAEWLDVSALPAPGRAFSAGVRVRR